jgi:hypothetical protein
LPLVSVVGRHSTLCAPYLFTVPMRMGEVRFPTLTQLTPVRDNEFVPDL